MPRTSPALALIFGLAVAASCRAPGNSAAPRVFVSAPAAAAEPEQRCKTFAGSPDDPDLDGGRRRHPARCCPSDYGFDPELARRSCGFAEYLGESEELACIHRFADHEGQTHELRLTPLLDLELADAIALHESGEWGPEHLAETPPGLEGIWWSADEGRRWALVSGWSMVRRLGWDEHACAPKDMRPVLEHMLATDDPRAPAVALPRAGDELTSVTAPADSLVTRSFEPRPSERSYPLPRAAEQLVLDLLGAAVAEDVRGFSALLEPGARIGLSDRRQLGARSLLGEPAAAAGMQELLAAAARFPATATLRCPEIDRRARPRVTRGEAPMWCFWISEDGLDLLTFALRGRVVAGQADARVAYVGVFPIRPTAPLVIPGEPPPPPIVARPELVCGDPHARSYPDLCPEPVVEQDDEELDAP